jgi:uncharacterized membrane protein
MDPTTPRPVTPSSMTTPPAVATAEDKTVAIVSYLTLIGFIAALIIHSNKKTRLGAFHLRQTLGLFLTVMAVAIGGLVLLIIPILGWLCLAALWFALFAFWVMGLLAAVKGEMKPVPVIGPMYQKWFGTTFD